MTTLPSKDERIVPIGAGFYKRFIGANKWAYFVRMPNNGRWFVHEGRAGMTLQQILAEVAGKPIQSFKTMTVANKTVTQQWVKFKLQEADVPAHPVYYRHPNLSPAVNRFIIEKEYIWATEGNWVLHSCAPNWEAAVAEVDRYNPHPAYIAKTIRAIDPRTDRVYSRPLPTEDLS